MTSCGARPSVARGSRPPALLPRLGATHLLLLLLASALGAHEVRPAYLALTETEPDVFEVLWKQPILPGVSAPGLAWGLALEPRIDPPCDAVDAPRDRAEAAALLRRWRVDCSAGGGLSGRVLEIEGLRRTLTDALVRIRFADGGEIVQLLKPATPRLEIDRAGAPGVAAYLRLGVEHLLFGADHILFVIGLLFLVRRPLELVTVITAFTIAHSITLALSALGLVTVPQAPVEALIALTILYLAVEILARPSPKTRPVPTAPGAIGGLRPWALAFGFGLLHGLGFAGALAEIGLPGDAIAPALFLFNVGVELGQLLVVALILGLLAIVRATGTRVPRLVVETPVWIMGSISAFWFIERTAGLL